MDKVQNKPNSSVQHTPSSEFFQVYFKAIHKILFKHPVALRYVFTLYTYISASNAAYDHQVHVYRDKIVPLHVTITHRV
jgi:hypothetical protein